MEDIKEKIIMIPGSELNGHHDVSRQHSIASRRSSIIFRESKRPDGRFTPKKKKRKR